MEYDPATGRLLGGGLRMGMYEMAVPIGYLNRYSTEPPPEEEEEDEEMPQLVPVRLFNHHHLDLDFDGDEFNIWPDVVINPAYKIKNDVKSK